MEGVRLEGRLDTVYRLDYFIFYGLVLLSIYSFT